MNAVQNSSCFTEDSMAKLKQIMYTQKFNAASILFHEGDPADKLYFIRTGKIKITMLSDEGKEYTMSVFDSGDFFGQYDPYPNSKHSFTAQVVEECEIGIIQISDLEVLLWQHGDLAIEFTRWMGYMHRLTQTKFRDLVVYGKPGALCSTLIRLSNSYGSVGETGIVISHRLTNAELADYIGCARESVNRMLSELRKAGAITISDGYITITNLKYLESVCKCEMCPKDLCRI